MPFMSVAEAGEQLPDLVGRAESQPTVLIQDRVPAAVIVGIAEYRALVTAGRRAREANLLPAIPQTNEPTLPYDFSDLDDLDLSVATR